MTVFYRQVCEELGWTLDEALVSKMEAANTEELAALEAKLEDAEQNLGETDISDALIAKAQYLSQIGEKVRNTPFIRPPVCLFTTNWRLGQSH